MKSHILVACRPVIRQYCPSHLARRMSHPREHARFWALVTLCGCLLLYIIVLHTAGKPNFQMKMSSERESAQSLQKDELDITIYNNNNNKLQEGLSLRQREADRDSPRYHRTLLGREKTDLPGVHTDTADHAGVQPQTVGDNTDNVAESQSKMADSQSNNAASQSKMAESQSHMAESQSHMAESQFNMAESEYNMANSQSNLAEPQSKVAELQSNMAESQSHMDQSQNQLAASQQNVVGNKQMAQSNLPSGASVGEPNSKTPGKINADFNQARPSVSIGGIRYNSSQFGPQQERLVVPQKGSWRMSTTMSPATGQPNSRRSSAAYPHTSWGRTFTSIPRHYSIYPTIPPSRLVNMDDVPVPRIQNAAVNCPALFGGIQNNPKAFQIAYTLTKARILKSRFLTPKEIYHQTANCADFIQRRQYVMDSITQEEAEFPVAYSIVMYYVAGQAERLLRAIYRPQNYYCLHIDSKAGLEVELSMERLAGCFDNVIVARNPTSVDWAYYGVLEAELICMRELVKYRKWKYFINLTGHEFPLKSNYEIVKILQIYNGSNEIANNPIMAFTSRWRYSHIPGRGRTRVLKTAPPHNITVHKGDVHVTLSRAFVEYILTDPVPLELAEWLKDAYCPEEFFFSSLQYNVHLRAPGAYSIDMPMYQKVISRHKVWVEEGRGRCKSGHYRHILCIFGLQDLHDLKLDRRALFINKLLDDYEPITYDCLEELYFNRTRDEYLGNKGFDLAYYAGRSFVKNHF